MSSERVPAGQVPARQIGVELETPAETIERCQKQGAEWLGDRVEYAFTKSVDAPRAAAIAIFERHGFKGVIPERPKAESILKSAGREGRQPKGYITREFVSPNKDTPIAIHVTRVTGEGEAGDEYSCLARVRIGQRRAATGFDEPYCVARPPDSQSEFPDETARQRALWIAERANHLLDHVATKDVSDAMRLALRTMGAVQSVGGGNNYYVPVALCQRVHALLSDCKDELEIYYLRDPKTTLGAKHEREAMQQAAETSFSDDLKLLYERLVLETNKAKHPTLHQKTGTPLSRTATLTRQIEELKKLGTRLDLYKGIVEERILSPLAKTRALYEKAFAEILNGDDVSFGTEDSMALPIDFPEPVAEPALHPKLDLSQAAPAEPLPVVTVDATNFWNDEPEPTAPSGNGARHATPPPPSSPHPSLSETGPVDLHPEPPAELDEFGYPSDWPKCPSCGKPALDGHITCGALDCNEQGQRNTHLEPPRAAEDDPFDWCN